MSMWTAGSWLNTGIALTTDLDAELTTLEAAQMKSMERVWEIDFANRTAEELAPMVYDVHCFRSGRCNFQNRFQCD
ncbi:MAG: hypothetical protein CFH00_00559 [Alphaproteobacteria bacterium MarineAlpha1_Bin1]|nr:MAG: hypothetical protein CFH00_00559 [Alphaproteobacteria bacterium MarineAlpha1_Bin1]